MSTQITKAFICTDPRFDVVERCLRALLPGAVLIAKYPADAPRIPDPSHPIGLQAIPPEQVLADEAVPERVELCFMPPPGLDFDSRHPIFGLLELEAVVDEFKAFINAELEKVSEDPGMVYPVQAALALEREAVATRNQYLSALTDPALAALDTTPTADAVIHDEERARNAKAEVLAALRMEQTRCLAPSVAVPHADSHAVTVPLDTCIAATAAKLAELAELCKPPVP